MTVQTTSERRRWGRYSTELPDTWHTAHGTLAAGEVSDGVVGAAKYLGAGVSRGVYSLGDGTVLKVARNERIANLHTNCNEVAVWVEAVRRYRRGDLPYRLLRRFARIVAADPSGYWLVMEEAQHTAESFWPWSPWGRWENMKNMPLAERRREWCRKLAARRTLAAVDLAADELCVEDTHNGNIGYANGRWCVIDYAFDSNYNLTDWEDNGGTYDDDDDEDTCSCMDCHRDGCDWDGCDLCHGAESCAEDGCWCWRGRTQGQHVNDWVYLGREQGEAERQAKGE